MLNVCLLLLIFLVSGLLVFFIAWKSTCLEVGIFFVFICNIPTFLRGAGVRCRGAREDYEAEGKEV